MPAYKDKNTNTWFCKFYYVNNDGKNVQKKKRGFKTKKEALEFENSFLVLRQNDLNMLFSDFLKVYKQDKYAQLRQRSQLTKDSRYKKILQTFGDYPLNEITPRKIIDWQNRLVNEGLSSSYINILQSEFITVLNHAHKFYGLKENPFHNVDRVKVPDEVPEPMRFWTLEEFKEVYKCIDDIKAKTAINLLYWSGIRKGELLALNWGKIDFDNSTMLVDRSLQRIKGKDIITATKTYESRKIRLPKHTMKQLEEYRNKCYNINKDDRVFPWEKRFIENGIKQGVNKANQEIKEYNLQHEDKKPKIKRIHVHGLRHSHASYLINHNINIVLISKRLGHKKTSITLDTYSHFFPTADDELISIMNHEEDM